MPKIVKFDTYAQATAADLNAISSLLRGSVDYLTRHLLYDEARYIGYNVTAADAYNISVAAGALVVGGRCYDTTTATALSITNLLPSANLRTVLVVVSGEEVETDTETRKFLTDVTTRTTQPKSTTTRISRQANVELIAGTAAASPSRPSVPSGALVVASFTISATGIVSGSLAMETANATFRLETAIAAINTLNANLKKTNSLLTTLRSDIASLAAGQKKLARASEVEALQTRTTTISKHVNVLQNKVSHAYEALSLSDEFSYMGFDTFGTDDESDTGNGAYTAVIEGGRVRFGRAEKTTKLTALLSANDSKVDITTSGLIAPVGTDTLRIECDDKDSEVAIASYQVTTTEMKQKTLTKSFIWYASATGRTAQEDYFASNPKIKLYDPEADAWSTVDLTTVKWKLVGSGKNNIWTVRVTSAYWDKVTTTKTVTGARLCQTFLCAQSGWHRRIDLGFTSIGPTGDVHVALCELDDDGYPDRTAVLETATVAVADLKTWPTWTPFEFDPVWLDKGQRYGIIITTTGNHKLGMSTSDDLTNGTLMTWTSGSIWSIDLAKDACFRLYGIRYAATTVIVDIEDITVAGGITEVQSILHGYEPTGTALILQARIAGVWRSLTSDDQTVLAAKPTQLPLRFVFKGTKDVMPAINISKSAIIASRPLSSSVHVSTVRTLPVNTTTTVVYVTEIATGFDESVHDWTVKLLTGAGYATEVVATAVKTEELLNGRVSRLWKFAGLPAISAYKIETIMTTNNAGVVFDVEKRYDNAV